MIPSFPRSFLPLSTLLAALLALTGACSGSSATVAGTSSDGAAGADASDDAAAADDGAAGSDAGADVAVGGGCAGVTATAKLSTDIQPILTASCTRSSCHGGGAPKAGLPLSAGASYAGLVNATATNCTGRARVVPGDVSKSYLVNKLTGVGMCGGAKMPEGGSLTAAQIDLFRAWICAGAKND
jgi:hypothetical protein